VPVKFHDGIWFPEEAKSVQQLDLSSYAGTTEAFWKSPRAEELDTRLRSFAPTLAGAVGNAPPFDPGWPILTPEPAPPPSIPLARFVAPEGEYE